MVEAAREHPEQMDVRTAEQIEHGEPEIVARLPALGDSAGMLKIWPWAQNAADGFAMNCDLRKTIKQRFDAQGIDIPFPQRTLSYAGAAPSGPYAGGPYL